MRITNNMINGKYQDKYQFNKGFGGQIQYPDDYSKEDIQGIRGSGYRNQIASACRPACRILTSTRTTISRMLLRGWMSHRQPLAT